MKIEENVEMAPMTTFGIGGPAKYFTEVTSKEELLEAFNFAEDKNLEVFVIGGGGNLLVSDDGFDGMVIKVDIKGREVLVNDVDDVVLKVGSGENLDEVIDWTVDSQWWGMENLSLIPGSFGGLVIQNVNAYGAKAEHIVEEVEVYDKEDGQIKVIKKEDCNFGYRSSIFNTTHKGRYVVLYVTVKLDRLGDANLKYMDLKKYLGKKGIKNPSIRQVRSAIINIRKRKGFDVSKVKSAGSFFKNLLLTKEEYRTLLQNVSKNYGDHRVKEIDDIRRKFSEEGEIKVPLAYILDKLLELKGFRVGGAKLSEMQVLNLTNAGDATAKDVLELFKKVRNMVYEKTGMVITNEPEFVGFSKEELDYYLKLD